MSDETQPSTRPATFREVLGQREYRAVYAASALSWLGDYISKAAVTVIVYQESRSVALSAAAFAISYLPWLVGGPLLATIAERYPYRNVMVACDLARMALVALIVIPGVPVPIMLVILFVATLANPPSQAARSALMPLILPGDKLVLGLSLNNSTGQVAQVAGYALGASIAAFNPRAAIIVDVSTFAASALIIWFGTRHRPPAMRDDDRSNLFRETGEGFRLVFGTRVLRGIALLVFASMLFSIVPEGLAAAWAQERADGTTAGIYQAMIMAANPIGYVIGGLLMIRLVKPAARRKLVRPFAVLAPLVLVPALVNPAPIWVALLAAASGFAVAGLLPVANGLFVQALPDGYRARAFGVMATGLQLTQGAAVLVTGILAERFDIPTVVGFWSIAGVLLMLAMAGRWPTTQQFDVAIAEAAKSRAAPTEPPATETTGAPVEPGQRGPQRPAHAQP